MDKRRWDGYTIGIRNAWVGLASQVVAFDTFKPLLSRLSYFGLLILFWWYRPGEVDMYQQILWELIRFKGLARGEYDHESKHWTVNIMDALLMRGLDYTMLALIPNRFWTRTIIGLLVYFLLMENMLVKLWLYRTARLLHRWNDSMWLLREFVIELITSRVSNLLISSYAQPMVHFWWELCFSCGQGITSNMVDTIMLTCSALYFFGTDESITRKAVSLNNIAIGYYQFLRHLIPFANPRPRSYRYRPLKNGEDIRVLLIYPRFGLRTIRCSLISGPYRSTLMYEAISYTWGHSQETEEILLDGSTKMVTPSVYEILCTYSSYFFLHLVWIDALCIDQANVEEKSRQVPLMQKIYGSGNFTTVFLGRASLPKKDLFSPQQCFPYRYDRFRLQDAATREHYEDARLACDLLKEIYIQRKYLLRNLDLYEMYESFQATGTKGREWIVLIRMLRHPWFERVWVVQEVILSPEVRVRYGDEVIDWRVLAAGIRKLHASRGFLLYLEWTHGIQLRRTQHSGLYNIQRMYRLSKSSEWDEDFITHSYSRALDRVTSESFYFKASDPRDLIYGLMSLCEEEAVEVDYNRSVQQVYTDATERLVSSGNTHIIFHATGVGNRCEAESIAALPSWVPDWTNAPKYERLPNPDMVRLSEIKRKIRWNSALRADLPNLTGIRVGESLNLLVSTALLDHVVEVGPRLFESTISSGEWSLQGVKDLAQQYHEVCGFIEGAIGDGDTASKTAAVAIRSTLQEANHPIKIALRHILCLNLVQQFSALGGNLSPARFAAWESAMALFRTASVEQLLAGGEATYKLLQDVDEVTAAVKATCGQRRAFVSQEGHIGLCPPYAKPGDLVCKIRRMKTPFMLRPCETSASSPPLPSPKQMQLVGQCYSYRVHPKEADPIFKYSEALEII